MVHLYPAVLFEPRIERAKDGSARHLYGFRAIPYDMPRGSAMGYMPELNALCSIGDYSVPSDQPLMKHRVVEIKPSTPPTEKGLHD